MIANNTTGTKTVNHLWSILVLTWQPTGDGCGPCGNRAVLYYLVFLFTWPPASGQVTTCELMRITDHGCLSVIFNLWIIMVSFSVLFFPITPSTLMQFLHRMGLLRYQRAVDYSFLSPSQVKTSSALCPKDLRPTVNVRWKVPETNSGSKWPDPPITWS